MDDSERDELLYRLDERTENVENAINDLRDHLSEQDEQVSNNESRSRRNATLLNIVTGVVAFTGTVVAENFTSIINF